MPNPFVGPRPFGQDDIIYGRDLEISELRYMLSAKRIVVLHSPSGAGKSSLVQAKNGLITKLGNTERFDVWGSTRVNLTPGANLKVANRFAWSAIVGLERTYPAKLIPALERPSASFAKTTLHEYVTSRPATANPLLIFDQFEEILRLDPANAQLKYDFFEQLGQVLAEPNIWALFIVREDCLAALRPFLRQVPTHLQNRYRLDFLRREDQAREAIVKPLEGEGRRFSDVPDAEGNLPLDWLLKNLATTKVDGKDEVGETIEPLQLQVVCQNLWSKLEKDPRIEITKELVGDPSDALAKYYRNAVRRDSAADERNIRNWFEDDLLQHGIRQLVWLDPTSNQVGNLPADEAEKLETESYLVRKESRGGRTFYELCHDRLVEPIEKDNRDWKTNLSPFQRAAELWNDQGRRDDLLLSGESLLEGREWAEGRVLEAHEDQFLKDSIQAEEKARLLRVLRKVVLGLGIVSFICCVVAIFFYLTATEQRKIAIAEQFKAMWADVESDFHRRVAVKAESNAKVALANSDLAQVARLYDAGKVNEALAYLSRALRKNAGNSLPRIWAAGLLGRGNHRVPQREFPVDSPVKLARFSPQSSRFMTVQASERTSTVQQWQVGSDKPIGRPLTLPYQAAKVRLGPAGIILAVPGRAPQQWLGKPPAGGASLWMASGGKWKEYPLGEFRPDSPLDAAFSPDFRHVVTLAGGDLRVWTMPTKQPNPDPPTLHLEGQPIESFSLSRTGALVLARTAKDVSIWNWSSDEAPRSIPGPFAHADFSWDGTRLITVSSNKISLWDLTQPELANPAQFTLPDTPVETWMTRTGLLVTVGSNRELSTWAINGPNLRLITSHDERASGSRRSADGLRLLTWDRQIVNVWDLRSGEQIAQMQHGGRVNDADFSPDGQKVIAGSDDRVALLWNVGVAQPHSIRLPQNGGILDVAIGSKGELAVAGYDGVSLSTPLGNPASAPQRLLAGRAVRQIGFAQQRMYTVSWNRERQRWEVDLWDGAKRINTQPMYHLGRIGVVAISPDGKRVFTGSQDRGRLWNAVSGEPLSPDLWHGGLPVFAAFLPANQLVSAAGKEVFLWDAATGRQLRHFPVAEPLAHAAIAGDNSTMLLAFNQVDGKLRLQRANLKRFEPRDLDRHNKGVFRVAISGAHALSTSADPSDGGQFWLMNSATPLPIGLPLTHADRIVASLFNSAGTLAITASQDKTAQIWDPNTGLALGQPLLHARAVRLAALGSTYAATVSDDASVQIWNLIAGDDKDPLAADDLAHLAHVIGGAELGDDATVKGLSLAERHEHLRELRSRQGRKSPDIDQIIQRLWERSGLR